MTYLLLHGLGQTAAQWKAVAGQMGESEVLCPELAGWLGAEADYGQLYRGLEAFCAPLARPLCLCGLSLGGILALHYAVEHPEKVDSLVLIGTQYKMPKRLLRVQNAVFRLLPNRAFRSMGMGKREVIRLTQSMMALDFEDGLAKLRCPVLLLCGERDTANLAAARQMKGKIPQAELRVLPGAGHEVNVDAPSELGEILRNLP